MSDARDTAPDSSPHTDRDPGPSTLTPDVAFQSEGPTDLDVARRALEGTDDVPPDGVRFRSPSHLFDPGVTTPVSMERPALVGLDRTHPSRSAPSSASTTSGHTERSLPEIERPTSSLRAFDGRFASIEHRLDQLDARLRLLEKSQEKASVAARSTWVFWALVLLSLVIVQLLVRRA